MPSLRPLLPLAQLSGTDADDDLAERARALFTDPETTSGAFITVTEGKEEVHGQKYLDSFLHPSHSYRLGSTFVEARVVNGQIVLVLGEFQRQEGAVDRLSEELKDFLADNGLDVEELNDEEFDEDLRITRVLGPYASGEESAADAQRALLGFAIAGEVRWMTGWKLDVVMLLRGHDWYIVRTRQNGAVEVEACEDVLPAHGYYVEACNKLARELEYGSSVIRDSTDSWTRKIATAFVQREAGRALAAQARHSLKVTFEGIARIKKLRPGSPHSQVNISELARNLYTDRPNLSKLQPSTHPKE